MVSNSKKDICILISSWKTDLIVIFSIYALVLLTAAGLSSYANLTAMSNKTSILWLSLIVLTGMSAVCFLLFKNRIYNPVKTIETAARILEMGEIERYLSYDQNIDRAPNADRIRDILRWLYHSVNRQYSAEILKRQAEFAALQSQINPHFLYNTLESIRGQALEEGVEEIAEMTEALSTFFRYSISKKGDLVPLEDELSNVENYFIIQQYRFDNKFNFSIKYDEADNDILNYMLPKLTIQPIVENSIFHGLETKVGKGNITIRITATEKRLILNISDDGVGMDKTVLQALNDSMYNPDSQAQAQSLQKEQNHTGIALANVNMRIKLLFGEQYGITVSSTKGLGTDVEVVIPLVKEDGAQNIRNLRQVYEN